MILKSLISDNDNDTRTGAHTGAGRDFMGCVSVGNFVGDYTLRPSRQASQGAAVRRRE